MVSEMIFMKLTYIKTADLMQMVHNVIYETVKKNGKILFVCTKVQASDIVADYTEKCGQYCSVVR